MASSQHALGSAAPAPCVPRYFHRTPHPSQGLPGQHPLVPVYMQPPPAPCVPFQWPVPLAVPFNSPFGLPPVGFSMAMLPVPSAPYMEPPAYMAHPSQLPLGDYMRMVPPHPPFVNFPTQRLRRQLNPPSRMVSSGVQTLTPETAARGSRTPGAVETVSNSVGSDSGRGSVQVAASTTSSVTPPCTPRSALFPRMEELGSSEGKLTAVTQKAGTPNSDISQVEVRCVTPSVEQSPCGDGMQYHSSPAGGAASTHRSPVHASSIFPDAGTGEQTPSRPNVLTGEGSPSVSSSIMIGCECDTSDVAKMTTGAALARFEISSVWARKETSDDEELSMMQDKEVESKIVKLPFDCHYAAAWRQRFHDQSVWSVESLSLFQPPEEWLAKHGLLSPQSGSDSEADAEIASNRGRADDLENVDQGTVAVSASCYGALSSSSDSLPPFIPAASWLSEFEKMFSSGKLHLCTQEHHCVPVKKHRLQQVIPGMKKLCNVDLHRN